MKDKPHTFAKTQHCWQHHITHSPCRYLSKFQLLKLQNKNEYWRYTNFVKFHLVAHQWKFEYLCRSYVYYIQIWSAKFTKT